MPPKQGGSAASDSYSSIRTSLGLQCRVEPVPVWTPGEQKTERSISHARAPVRCERMWCPYKHATSTRPTTREMVVSPDPLSRARAGDEDAFRELVDPYRRELQLHCYRILGSLQDAEDTVQETLLAAWRGLNAFQGRASLRNWLYRIATNRCLNALRD